MKFYLAPMEGITTYIYRTVYNRYFGGIDKYFTPFIASKKMNRRELNEILPEHNQGLSVVPQILTNRAEEFLQIARKIAEFGYDTVNLNLGCPSGTVTARKRGAGFLSVPDELDRFLYEIYAQSPLHISIKTRIGIASVDEWETILAIYQKYPLAELIIHPRLQKEFYKLTPHKEAFASALAALPGIPLCYNGDVTSPQSLSTLLDAVPQTNCVMIGRGILRNPALVSQLTEHRTVNLCSKDALRAFHDEVFEGYAAQMSGETPTLFKMKDLWTYFIESFEGAEKHLKKIRKASNYSEYKIAVNSLFRDCSIANHHTDTSV
ncbi:tRNA-dihydrouridine synthase family protein [Lachnospiraceae bacterium MD335]|nr:tRNA-dihydrouridine synthase family protein [Lachnospiraceae bacterium MD335]